MQLQTTNTCMNNSLSSQERISKAFSELLNTIDDLTIQGKIFSIDLLEVSNFDYHSNLVYEAYSGSYIPKAWIKVIDYALNDNCKEYNNVFNDLILRAYLHDFLVDPDDEDVGNGVKISIVQASTWNITNSDYLCRKLIGSFDLAGGYCYGYQYCIINCLPEYPEWTYYLRYMSIEEAKKAQELEIIESYRSVEFKDDSIRF